MIRLLSREDVAFCLPYEDAKSSPYLVKKIEAEGKDNSVVELKFPTISTKVLIFIVQYLSSTKYKENIIDKSWGLETLIEIKNACIIFELNDLLYLVLLSVEDVLNCYDSSSSSSPSILMQDQKLPEQKLPEQESRAVDIDESNDEVCALDECRQQKEKKKEKEYKRSETVSTTKIGILLLTLFGIGFVFGKCSK